MEIMIAAFGTAQRKQTRYIIVATMVVHIKVLFDIMQMKIYYSTHTIHNRGKIEVCGWSEGAIPSAGIQVMVNTVID